MLSKKNLSLLLVATITAGSINLLSDNGSFAQAARQKDSTVVAVNELSDVESDAWAYNAVQQLVEKYDVLEGYPSGKYEGKKSTTRFELAASLYDLATYFGDEIALDRDDLSKLAKLMDEFSTELKTIQGRVDELEKKVAAIDVRTTTLEGTVAKHEDLLQEHEKRLAYAERRKGFILERLIKGLVVDARDLSRGMYAAVSAPFDKDISQAISK